MTETKSTKGTPKATTAPKATSTKASAPKLRDTTKYRVLDTREVILYPADDAQLERLQNGDKIPREKRRMKRARSGDVVSDLPAKSVPWMLKAGWICRAGSKDDPYKGKGAAGDDSGAE